MIGERIYEDLSHLLKRARVVFLIVQIVFAFLALFYWKLQIMDRAKYWAMSEANRTRDVVLPAPRAIITDRTGTVILADNIGSFKASLIRENRRDENESTRRVSRLLGLEENTLRERVNKFKTMPLFWPIVVKDNLDLEEVARIESRRADHPEVLVEIDPKRRYPFANLAAHALGYVQELTPAELRSGEGTRRLGDMIGRTGVESAAEARLAGTNGKTVDVVDSLGRKRDELERIEPQQKPKIALTLDYDLQAKAEELLAGREGAIVVLEAKTGGVLAMASYPTFDPNKFVNRFTPEEWLALIRNPDNPLLNRAIQGLYSPGSIFKPVMALTALETRTVGEGTTFFCSGAATFYDRPFRCWLEGGHGSLALVDAIRYSCNIYFYNLGRRISIDTIARYAGELGLGSKTGIEIPGEKEGLVPNTDWKKRTQRAPWYPGETISVAIGQGSLQVTPLQIAALTALLANRGTPVRPHLILESRPPLAAVDIPRTSFESVIEGMWRSVNLGGTGQSARIEGFDVCGKTGSTQLVGRETVERLGVQGRLTKTHSWFTGFAPRNDPRLTVTVLVEYGGMGGATAAPLAGELFRTFKAKSDAR